MASRKVPVVRNVIRSPSVSHDVQHGQMETILSTASQSESGIIGACGGSDNPVTEYEQTQEYRDNSLIQKQVEDELTCSICLGLYENPRALPCQHTYCENCIKAVALASSSNGRQVRCPECRKDHGMPEGKVDIFKINYKIRSLVDWTRGRLQPGKCKHHLEEYDHICLECKEPVCKKCTVTTHSGHRCVKTVQFAENMVLEVRGRKEALRKAKNRVETNMSELKHNKERAMQELDQKMNSIKHVIEQAQRDLADKITDTFQKKEVNLEKQKRSLQSDLDDLEGLEREEVLQTLHDSLNMPAKLPMMWNKLQTLASGGSFAPCENGTLSVEWDQNLLAQLTQGIKFGEVKVKPRAVAEESHIEVKPVDSADPRNLNIILFLKDGLGADAQSDNTVDIVAMVHTPGGRQGQLCEMHKMPGGIPVGRFSPRYAGKYIIEVMVSGDVVKNCPKEYLVEPKNKWLGSKQTTPSKLHEPHDIKVLNGDFVIAEKSHHRVIITDSNYDIKTILPNPAEGQFKPYGIAISGNDILVSDNSGRVVVYRDGAVRLQFGQAELQRPTGIDVHKRKVYVMDWQLSCIQVYTIDGIHIKTISQFGDGPNDLYHPWFAVFNSKGQLLVADSHNKRIQIFDPETSNEAIRAIPVKLGDNLLIPRGIVLDDNETIYVTVMERVGGIFPCLQCVVAFTQDGQCLGKFGAKAGFHYPRGIAVLNNANNVPIALIVDNHSVKEFEL